MSVGHFKSEKVSISCGVPQGSTLGLLVFNLSPLLPLCIINKHNIPYHSYADNTQIYTSVSAARLSPGKINLSVNARQHVRNVCVIIDADLVFEEAYFLMLFTISEIFLEIEPF